MPEAIATPRSRTAPRLLFVPVSGPNGSGELMRCLILARELRRADPAVEVHFLVSRNAVFREGVDFPVHDCDDSPTRSTGQVLETIERLRPDVVLFDNAGRTEQLRAAKAVGARLVFSSRSPRLRWKAFRITWLRLLDEHWIVFPKFVTGGLSAVERVKLHYSPAYRVRHLDTFFTPSLPAERARWLASQGLAERGYTVFVPGGRGEGAADSVDPAELFEAAAREYVQGTGDVAVVLTGRAQQGATQETGPLRLLPRIRPEEVQHLLAGAARVVSNGGTTLVHALAHGQAIVSVPLAADQARRVRRAVRRGVIVAARPEAADIARSAIELSRDEAQAASLRTEVARLGLVNGVDEAVAALRDLAYA